MNCSVKFFEPTVIVLPEAAGIFWIMFFEPEDPEEPDELELPPDPEDPELSLDPHAPTSRARATMGRASRVLVRLTLTGCSSSGTGRRGGRANGHARRA